MWLKTTLALALLYIYIRLEMLQNDDIFSIHNKKMRFKKGRNVSVRDWVTAAANASNDKIFVSVI